MQGIVEAWSSANIGANIQRLRRASGIHASDFSDRCHEAGLPTMSPTTISRLENGHRPVKLEEIPLLATALGVEPWAIIGANPKPHIVNGDTHREVIETVQAHQSGLLDDEAAHAILRRLRPKWYAEADA